MTDEELRGLFEELRLENTAAHIETRRYSEQLVAESQRHSEHLVAETRRHSEGLFGETRRHIDVLGEATRHEIGLLAEAIGFLREDLRRTEKRLDAKIDLTTAETQALIRFSHSEIDQRLRALEQ
jgi:hypothetical protein